MFNLIKSAIQITILSIVFLFSTYAVIAAWSEPAGGPTGNNAATPLDVSSTGQTKIGGLILNTGAAANGLIVSAGNVGIGTTNPGALLDVKAGTDRHLWVQSGANTGGASGGGINLGSYNDAANAFKDMTLAANQFGIITGGTERMTILSGGNVGIGTTSPVQLLSVAGTIYSGSGGFKFPDGTTQTSAAAGATLPTGMINFFNLSVCPTGWTELTGARGRYLVGLPASGTLAGTDGTALTNLEDRPTGQHTHALTDPGHVHDQSDFQNANTYVSDAGTTYRGLATGPYINDSHITVKTKSSTTGITIGNTGTTVGTNAPYIQMLVCSKN